MVSLDGVPNVRRGHFNQLFDSDIEFFIPHSAGRRRVLDSSRTRLDENVAVNYGGQ